MGGRYRPEDRRSQPRWAVVWPGVANAGHLDEVTIERCGAATKSNNQVTVPVRPKIGREFEDSKRRSQPDLGALYNTDTKVSGRG